MTAACFAAQAFGQDNTPADVPPLVSVVIPCYNQGRFLRAAIDSALAQTWQPLEIIVIDDGSTDCTADIIAQSPEVTGFRQSNAGLSAARNAGLRASRGAFVTFLDSDDLLLPRAISAGMDALAAHPEWALAWGGYCMFDANGVVPGSISIPTIAGGHYEALLKRNFIAMHGTVLYRCRALEKIGGFDTSLRSCEDYDLYFRIARVHDIGFHHEVAAHYRQHGDSMSRKPAAMLHFALDVLGRQKPYLTTPDLRRAYWQGVQFHRERDGGERLRLALGARGWRRVLGIGSAARMSRVFFPRVLGRQIARSVYRPLLARIRPVLFTARIREPEGTR